jgi:hypothetical protein
MVAPPVGKLWSVEWGIYEVWSVSQPWVEGNRCMRARCQLHPRRSSPVVVRHRRALRS